MFKSFSVENFRGFKKLSLDALSPINLIIGKNNVGKTALLEAIFLLLGATNTALSLTLNTYRNVDITSLDPEELFGPLFHNYMTNLPIQIASKDHKKHHHALSIELRNPKETNIDLNNQSEVIQTDSAGIDNITNNKELVYIYTDPISGEKIQTRLKIRSNNKINADVTAVQPFTLSTYIGNSLKMKQLERTHEFSRLERTGQHKKIENIINILQIIEPRLTRLVVSFSAGAPNLLADIGSQRLLPVGYMGDGINQLLSILLSINKCEGGCVLIDEIENGFHYSVLPQLWDSIGKLAKSSNTQIIATTHSMECIKAAYTTYKDSEMLSLYRLDRIKDDIKVISYDKEDLETSMNAGWEVR